MRSRLTADPPTAVRVGAALPLPHASPLRGFDRRPPPFSSRLGPICLARRVVTLRDSDIGPTLFRRAIARPPVRRRRVLLGQLRIAGLAPRPLSRPRLLIRHALRLLRVT